eukprot:TRINITY_DN2268_c2_g1_i2.p1 TRINITY_DN2268_c2_g1~~TRINITY_DN2268_c2_g1_i2.p1  ORF type:complete len:526 (+),score=38.29 TRINITY_DN2268_c2_g1_i2:54-1631(+)
MFLRVSKRWMSDRVLRGVVKVFATTCQPNYLLPWSKKAQQASSGSGFVVDMKHKLIITNAHVVMDAALIEVRKEGCSEKNHAELLYMGMDCDLALLTVQCDDFWKSMSQIPLYLPKGKPGNVRQLVKNIKPFDGIPQIQDSVHAIGYPIGGDQLSITSGVVSRIDIQPYAISIHTMLLSIQVDAAINAGNSGGPVLSNNKVIGMGFQSLMDADNISYLIPVPIIAHFLRHYYKHGRSSTKQESKNSPKVSSLPVWDCPVYHPGFCTLGCGTQEPHNKSLRESIGLLPEHTGPIIKGLSNRALKGIIKPGDVILECDGHKIHNDSNIRYGKNRVIKFTHLINMKSPGEQVHLKIFRKGKIINKAVTVTPDIRLVQPHLYNPYFKQTPKYVMFGGVVLSPLTIGYYNELKAVGSAGHLYNNQVFYARPTPEKSEVVMLMTILPHQVNQGYQTDLFQHQVVKSINDIELKSLRHANEILTSLKDNDFARIVILFGSDVIQTLTMKVGEARRAAADIQKTFSIHETCIL